MARNFLLMASSTMLTRILTFALGLVLARHLGVDDYGTYALAAAVALVVSAITDLGLDPYVTREVARDPSSLRRDLTTLLTARAALTVVALGGFGAWAVIDGGAVAVAGLLFYLTLVFDNLAMLVFAYEQGLQRMGFQAATTLATQVARTAGGIALAIASEDLVVVLAWMAVTGAIGMGVAGTRYLRRARPAPSDAPAPGVRTLLFSCSAMMLVVLANAVILRADSLIIGSVLGVREVGIYTAAYALVAAVQILPWIGSVVVYPVFAGAFGRDQALLQASWRDGLRAVLFMTLPAAVLASILGESIISGIYGSEFPRAGEVLGVLMWWIPLAGIAALTTALLRAAGRERVNAAVIGIGATVNVAANLVVVPRAGIVGAAVVTVLAELGMVSAALWIVRGEGVGVPTGRLARALPALGGLLAVAWLLRDAHPLLACVAALVVYAVGLLAARAVEPSELRGVVGSLRPSTPSPEAPGDSTISVAGGPL